MKEMEETATKIVKKEGSVVDDGDRGVVMFKIVVEVEDNNGG
jgi:hypothetical protein